MRRERGPAGAARAAAQTLVGFDFEGRDGRFYCYHFGFYPLVTMPARLALDALGGDLLLLVLSGSG